MAVTFHHHLLHYLFRPKSSSTIRTPPNSISLSLLPKTHHVLFSSSSITHSLSPPQTLALPAHAAFQHAQDSYEHEIQQEETVTYQGPRVCVEDEIEVEEEEIAVEKEEEEKVNVSVKPIVLLPSLSMKEKKELSTYAHGLGDKLKSQLVGKSGVTDSVAASFVENLESNELLKIKIHRTCPGELTDVVKHLQHATASVVISQIGRTVILYKPSLTKLKAEEKKMQNRKVFVRKTCTLKPTLPSRRHSPILPRLSGRGHRGGNSI